MVLHHVKRRRLRAAHLPLCVALPAPGSRFRFPSSMIVLGSRLFSLNGTVEHTNTGTLVEDLLKLRPANTKRPALSRAQVPRTPRGYEQQCQLAGSYRFTP